MDTARCRRTTCSTWSTGSWNRPSTGAPAEFTGEVALVTGAASGIGRACADALRAKGASIIGLDVTPTKSRVDYLGLQVDVTDTAA